MTLTTEVFLKAWPTLHNLKPTSTTCKIFYDEHEESCANCPFYFAIGKCNDGDNEEYKTFLAKEFPELLV